MILKRSLVAVAVFGATIAAQSAVYGGITLGEPGARTDPAVSVPNQYTAGAPAWAIVANQAAPTLVANMTNDWSGTATSNVYFVNGVDATGGLGFTYRFAVTSTTSAGEGLVRVSFAPDWAGVAFSDVGSDASGSATAGTGSLTWTDGDPYSISRNTGGAVSVNFAVDDATGGSGTLGNIIFAPGDYSALVWWETDAHSFSISEAALIDGGLDGNVAVYAVPVPGAVLLGAMGLGLVGWVRKRVN